MLAHTVISDELVPLFLIENGKKKQSKRKKLLRGALVVMMITFTKLLTTRLHKKWHLHSQAGRMGSDRTDEGWERTGHALANTLPLKEMPLNPALEKVSNFLLEERKISRNLGVL